jgi:hypothetical protein
MLVPARLTEYTRSSILIGSPEVMPKPEVICRHTLATRVMHWVNALCVFLVRMSGLQSLNAHPRLCRGGATKRSFECRV